jgi:glycosyltransferase involved in cell wall biosynthesis
MGIYRPAAPRDKVYLEGLEKLGAEIFECVDNSAGLLKFFRLWKKHKTLKNRYDILWVGYLSTMLVPLARTVSRKKIIFNALDSWYDRTVLDRGIYSRFSPKAWLIWIFDFLAFHLSDTVLVESEQQKIFIAKKFFVNRNKLKVVFTGVDETVFHPDTSVSKATDFTVVFRGLFLPATGVEFVIEAARILKNNGVKFIIVGWGEPFQSQIKKKIADYNLTNVTLITWFLQPDELRKTMLSAHIMLGQFGGHARLSRTIQNKNFEAMALGMPFITRDSLSNREILTDGINCILISKANPREIADAIVRLKHDESMRNKIAGEARAVYCEKLTSEILVHQFLPILDGLRKESQV